MKLLKKVGQNKFPLTFKFLLNFKELLLDCRTTKSGYNPPQNIIVSCLHKYVEKIYLLVKIIENAIIIAKQEN